jgi:hypothetical protein
MRNKKKIFVKKVPQAPPQAPIITVKHVRADENER